MEFPFSIDNNIHRTEVMCCYTVLAGNGSKLNKQFMFMCIVILSPPVDKYEIVNIFAFNIGISLSVLTKQTVNA